MFALLGMQQLVESSAIKMRPHSTTPLLRLPSMARQRYHDRNIAVIG
jgi:hypothetical protein